MKKQIKNIHKNRFVKNVLLVASGTAMAQIITLLLLPIITRLYGPDAYGIMGSFLAIINIFIPIAALSLPIAIVLPKEKKEALSIISASIKIILIISLLLFLIILLFKDFIIEYANLDEMGDYLLFIPLTVFLAGLSQILRQWLIRNNTFNVIANAMVFQSLVSHGSMVLIGLIYPVATVLILFTVLKQGMIAIYMYFKIKIRYKSLAVRLNRSNLSFKEVLKKYNNFPKYRAPESFLNGVSQGIPVLFMTSFFGVAAAGFYTLSRSVLQVPVNLLGKSVGDVFYPRISTAAHNKENLTKLLLKATFSLALIGVVPFSIIMVFGPQLFGLIFGNDWIVAGEYAQWISLWTYFAFMNTPSVKSFPVLNALRLHFIISCLMLCVRVIILILGYTVLNDDILTVALLGTTGALMNVLLISTAIFKAKGFDYSVIQTREE